MPGDLLRATATISGWNLVSRATGFLRVVAMGGALGATALGDTYQSANLISNILFELLAGGVLSAVLVPTFVDLLDRGRRNEAARLAGALLAKAVVALSVLVAVGMLAAPWIMRLLTVGVDDASQREAQVELGAFLLLFFLPQMLLYAAGAVATALLQADRRFTAAAMAPVANNLVVIATMIAFGAVGGEATGFDLTTAQKLVLALGTTGGVVAMTAVPLLAVWRGGAAPRPAWTIAGGQLRALAGKGLWAAGHLGLNQVLVAVTIVLAARVEGGVVAYQIAFTFFLLPHAVLSNPIFTALFPRLSADAAGGRLDAFARDLGTGLRYTGFLLLPATGLLAALAAPLLAVVRLGELDRNGAELVAAVLAGYALGLLGYSSFFLLTRASYALGDARSPTVVNLVATAVAVVAMVVASSMLDGDDRVVVLGLVHAVVMTGAAASLLGRVRSRLGRPVPIASAWLRDLAVGGVAVLAAWVTALQVGWGSRPAALLALLAGGVVGAGVYLVGQWATDADELHAALRSQRPGRA